MIRRRLRVGGRVQGVYFRASLRKQALARGVAGWARNLDDGGVEAVLEGPPEAVAAVVEYCRRGPPDAWVTRVEVGEEPPEGLAGFRIA